MCNFDHVAMVVSYTSGHTPGYGMTFLVYRPDSAWDVDEWADRVAEGAIKPSDGWGGESTGWQLFGLTFEDCGRL